MSGLLSVHGSWVMFFGTLVFGESVVLAGSAIAATGRWSVLAVAAWSFLGTLVADTAWFLSARDRADAWSRDPDRADRLRRATERVDRMAGAHAHRALLFVKFFYGTRIASLAYMAVRGVRLATFLAWDACGTAVWLAVVVPLGVAIGRGASGAGVDLRRAEEAAVVIVLVAVLVRVVVHWWRNRSDPA